MQHQSDPYRRALDDYDQWIRQKRIEGFSSDGQRQDFVPLSALTGYLKRTGHVKELLKAVTNTHNSVHAETVRDESPRVFTILLRIGKGSWIDHFSSHPRDLSDRALPFPEQKPGVLSGFDDESYKKLRAEQWSLCSPVLTPQDFRYGFPLFPEEILPFVTVRRINKGGSAELFEIEIHPDHDRLRTGQNGTQSTDFLPRTYALKRYRGQYAESNYKQELEAFHRLSGRGGTTDIVGYFGAFQHGESFNLILEYADKMDLEQYFQSEDRPKAIVDILHFWEGQRRLVYALLNLHGHGSGEDIPRGFHQDLKPSNVLVMSCGRTSPYEYMFKVGDLNTAHFASSSNSKTAIARSAHGSLAYAPPECYRSDQALDNTNIFISQQVDIWSLGCIWLEAAVWVVFGHETLDDFRQRRGEEALMLGIDAGVVFHRHDAVLQTVTDMYRLLQDRALPDDTLTLKIVDIIKEMLSFQPGARPELSVLKSRVDGAITESRATIQFALPRQAFGVTSSSPATYPNAGGFNTPARQEVRDRPIDTVQQPYGSQPRSTSYTYDGNAPLQTYFADMDFGQHGNPMIGQMGRGYGEPAHYLPESTSGGVSVWYQNGLYLGQRGGSALQGRNATRSVAPTHMENIPGPRQEIPMSDQHTPARAQHPLRRTSTRAEALRHQVTETRSNSVPPGFETGIQHQSPSPYNSQPVRSSVYTHGAFADALPQVSNFEGYFGPERRQYSTSSNNSPEVQRSRPTQRHSDGQWQRRHPAGQSHHRFSEPVEMMGQPITQDLNDYSYTTGVLHSSPKTQLEDIPDEEAFTTQPLFGSHEANGLPNTITPPDRTPYHPLEERDYSEIPRLKMAEAKAYISQSKKNRDPELKDGYLINDLDKRDHVFVFDNSLTMGEHWMSVVDTAKTLAWFVKKVDRDGLELRSAIPVARNQNRWNHIKTSTDVEKIATGLRKYSKSNLTHIMDEILDTYRAEMNKEYHRRKQKWVSVAKLTPGLKPMTIYVFTDGVWEPRTDLTDTILRTVDALKATQQPSTQVGIQFIQFGNDPVGTERMEKLDNLKKHCPGRFGEDIRDIVDHIHIDEDNMWKMLFGSTNRTFDGDR
ncbi:hypothetical protein BDV96DRAFT_34877 [Lophiotrema nucula]|uniref:Protein kinase domain-containing protein n=1 Tax=Lophiotrema nucula TaxID=690887 RepID=A0A6A5ZC45_9PLEO|nr:hypothetical protein BDV96DRAFT_34877 [Lophiotrema nucula]